MASFADTQPAPLTPYVPKYDTNLYAKVLSYKQNQYDMGLQRAQSAVDAISGIEVLRPVDRDYVQSKFNDLTTKVNDLAGADFSSQAVVGQVAGLASQIYKDRNVQNALLSTQSLKQLSASQLEMQEKHPEKYGPQAKYWDDLEVERYMNNPNAGAVYRGPNRATAYEDYNKDLRAVLKELSPQVDYKINAQGAFEYQIDKNSSITPAQVKQVVDGFFETNPRYKQSLLMDSTYIYKDMNGAMLNKWKNNYLSQAELDYSKANINLQKQIDANPNNLELINRNKQAIADNIAILNESKNAINSANPEDIKFLIFNEQIRNNAILNYQKDIHEIGEIKETPIAGRFTEFLKVGLNPENGEPLQPGDKYYTTWQALKKNNKGKEGGDNVIPGITDLTITIGDQNKPGAYTSNENLSQIQSLEQEEQTWLGNLKQAYFDKPSAIKSDASFNAYLNNQRSLLENGEKVDDTFLEYEQRTMPIRVKLGALKELRGSISEKAAQEFPMNSLSGIEIKDIPITYSDGRTLKGLRINPEDHASFLGEFKNFYSDVQEQIFETTKSDTGEVQPINIDTNYGKKIANDIIETKYANSPNKDLLKSLANYGMTKSYNKIVNPVDDLLSKRMKREDELMQERGKIWSYNMAIVGGKEEEVKVMRRLTAEAINENTKGEEPVDENDIEPRGVYADINGNQFIRYKEKNKNEEKSVQYTGNETIVPNYDSGRWLTQVIETAGKTPIKGEGVMHSDNGKLRYSISKNNFNGGYNISVLDGDEPIRIVTKIDPNNPMSPVKIYNNPMEIVGAMNSFSTIMEQKNPYTNRPYTTEEAIYSLTHSTEEFNDYMKNKISR